MRQMTAKHSCDESRIMSSELLETHGLSGQVQVEQEEPEVLLAVQCLHGLQMPPQYVLTDSYHGCTYQRK